MTNRASDGSSISADQASSPQAWSDLHFGRRPTPSSAGTLSRVSRGYRYPASAGGVAHLPPLSEALPMTRSLVDLDRTCPENAGGLPPRVAEFTHAPALPALPLLDRACRSCCRGGDPLLRMRPDLPFAGK